MNPFDELERFYPDIIAEMGPDFDSHEFILKLAHRHQCLYIEALARYDEEPFRVVHAELSRRLHKFDHLVEHKGFHHSPNIFGESTEAARWRKTT